MDRNESKKNADAIGAKDVKFRNYCSMLHCKSVDKVREVSMEKMNQILMPDRLNSNGRLFGRNQRRKRRKNP